MPESSPPPPHGTTTASSARHFLVQLQRRGPLAGDHVPVVERRDERRVFLLERPRDSLARLGGRIVEHDPGAERRGRLALDRRRVGGITIVVRTPSIWPTRATAWAWLPDE